MGQTSSHSAQDGIKPEYISSPMPLVPPGTSGHAIQSARSSRPRSSSGEGNRLRRERRRSRDHTGSSPSSPTVDSPPLTSLITSSIPERTQSPRPLHQPSQHVTTRRRSSTTTTATAPPPYTAEPAGLDVSLAEAPPPPVPPRDRQDSAGVNRRMSAHAEKPRVEFVEPSGRHRRTVSHSSSGPSSSRASSPPVTRMRQMPLLVSTPSSGGMGVGGFRVDMGESPGSAGSPVEFSTAGGTPSIYSQFDRRPRTPPPRARSGDHGSARALPARRGSREDPLEMLRRYKTVMVVDDSSSMEGESWIEARDALAGLADAAAKYDQEGIDVHFLNDQRVGVNMQNGVEVKRLFDYIRPNGITPTGQKLEELLLAYMDRLERARDESAELDRPILIKPVNFIVITDGAPTDDPESVIVAIARRLDAGHFPLMQVGIQFVQIGTAEDTAEALKELDDGLAQVHGIRDMVDTTPYTGSQFNTELLVKILLGGINRRVDRYGAAAVMD